MKFKHHILIGLIGSILISYIFDLTYIEWLIIFASSILIDIDHYFWYMNETKTINPFKAIKWYIDHQKYSIWKKLSKEEKSKYKRGFYAFHGIEFWLILILLSFWNITFLFILIGIMLHIVPDVSYLIWKEESPLQKISQIYVLKRNKNKRSLVNLWKE